jgi:hypothetical protein
MKKENKTEKKVFLSSASDRGILVKFSKDKKKVSISFWGNDNPKNISFSKEEALDICEYILENARQQDGQQKENPFESAYKNMKNILPKTHFVK